MATRRKTPLKPKRRKPEALRLRDIAASLTVNDLQASLAWYRDVVGFTLDETWEHGGKVAGVSLKGGGAYVNLSPDGWGKGRGGRWGGGGGGGGWSRRRGRTSRAAPRHQPTAGRPAGWRDSAGLWVVAVS